MKYVNSLKYIENFPQSNDESMFSQRRIAELCKSLGGINVGVRFINIPSGVAGHGCAVMLENIIKDAGYTVGRIVSPQKREVRDCVLVGGEIPSIADFNGCVAEIKDKVSKNYQTLYLREEIVFVLSLLLCRLNGCDFIILEGTEKFDRVCAPYELAIIPTIYASENAVERIVPLCDVIRRGTREVVSGNQKSDVYNYISSVCAPSGLRLFIPVKSQFEITDTGLRLLSFNYNGREGFRLKSPSYILRDCAMTVIEAVMAMRREGIRIPISAVISGLENAGCADSFEIISYMPTIIVDNADDEDEITFLYKTFCDIIGESKKISLCIPYVGENKTKKILSVIPSGQIVQTIVCTNGEQSEVFDNGIKFCRTRKDAAKIIADDENPDSVWLCFGGNFGQEIKEEIIKEANK